MLNNFYFSILIDPRTKQNWKKCLLFLNFMMERDSSLRHLCLSSKNKAIIIDSLHFKDTSDTDHDPSNLENIFENSSYYLDQILYGQGIFIGKIISCLYSVNLNFFYTTFLSIIAEWLLRVSYSVFVITPCENNDYSLEQLKPCVMHFFKRINEKL